MGKIKQAIYRAMAGRYGPDTLGNVLLWTMLGVVIVDTVLDFFDLSIWISLGFSLVTSVLAFFVVFRMLSRNIAKRRRENEVFCNFFKLRRNRFRDRKTHVYRKCKHCKAVLRLPKAKGKHTVLCPRCHKRFETRG